MYLYFKDINMEVLLLLLLAAMGGIVLGNFISLMFEDTLSQEKETAKKLKVESVSTKISNGPTV